MTNPFSAQQPAQTWGLWMPKPAIYWRTKHPDGLPFRSAFYVEVEFFRWMSEKGNMNAQCLSVSGWPLHIWSYDSGSDRLHKQGKHYSAVFKQQVGIPLRGLQGCIGDLLEDSTNYDG